MKVNLKIHSTLKHLFTQQEYTIDVPEYLDVYSFIYNINPRFQHYVKAIQNRSANEGVALVDSKFRVIDFEKVMLKKPKQNETIYVSPVIVGGGGKRGFAIFAAVAFVTLAVATGGFGLAAAPGLSGAGGLAAGVGGIGANPLTAYGAVSAAGSASTFGSFVTSALGTFAKSLLGNLAIAAVTSIFTKRPSSPVASTTDAGTRSENNMFGSLQNTTTSGTPVPLNYGLMRVAGQFLSGYLHTTQHGKSNSPSVQSIFDATTAPNQQDIS